MLKLTLFSLVLFSGIAIARDEIPIEFQGVWDKNEQACTERFSDMRHHITASTIEYWESSGLLLEIIESKSISLIARFEMSGEGNIWMSLNTYFLTHGKDRLTQVFDDGTKVIRIRCNVTYYQV